jgi:recombination associated protein RdgC
MQFKNLIAYRLTQPLQLDQDALEKALATKGFRPCESQEASTSGFVSALPSNKAEETSETPALSLWAENCVLLCLMTESKILPSAAINQKVKDKVTEIEKSQLRKVYRKEKDQIKDEVLLEYLPKALSKRSTTYAAIDLKDNLVYVDANTHKQAEALLSTLREAIGSLPVRPVSVKISPSATLTDWLKNQQTTNGFFILSDCEMRTIADEVSVARFTNEDLSSEEVLNHIRAGKMVTKLSLAFEDKLSFTLMDNMQIKAFRLEDLLLDQASKDGGDDSVSQYSATFVMSILTLRNFLPNLFEALGGEEVPTSIDDAADKTQPVETAEEELIRAAEQFVVDTQRASISAIQRKFKIGYNQAARLVESLEAKGVVSAMNQQGARTVLAPAGAAA